jgi:cell division protein FtsB
MSRQSIYILLLSIILLIFVLGFSFEALIPEGKEYRLQRVQLAKEHKDLRRYQEYDAQVFDELKQLQSEHRHIITAFDREFDKDRFVKKYQGIFNTLTLTRAKELDKENGFSVYKVKTSSKISSPTTFYRFLDEINKSDWIVSVDFPINFKRDGDVISSSFEMRVYSNVKDSKSSK